MHLSADRRDMAILNLKKPKEEVVDGCHNCKYWQKHEITNGISRCYEIVKELHLSKPQNSVKTPAHFKCERWTKSN